MRCNFVYGATGAFAKLFASLEELFAILNALVR
jgi:hypothetical protein